MSASTTPEAETLESETLKGGTLASGTLASGTLASGTLASGTLAGGQRASGEHDRLANGMTVWLTGLPSAGKTPYRAARDEVRAFHDSRLVEVFLNAPVELCQQRDGKSIYSKARVGEITALTGYGDRYEAPTHPEVVVHTELETIDESVAQLWSALAGVEPSIGGTPGVEPSIGGTARAEPSNGTTAHPAASAPPGAASRCTTRASSGGAR